MPELIGRVSTGRDGRFEYYEYDDRHSDEHERYDNRNELCRGDNDDGDNVECQRNDFKCDDDDKCRLRYYLQK